MFANAELSFRNKNDLSVPEISEKCSGLTKFIGC